MEPQTPAQNIQPNTDNQSNNLTPLFEKPKLKTNWLISFTFLILGTAIGVVGLLVYQKYLVNKPIIVSSPSPVPPETVDSTANWKTYTNTQYGFSFKYPENGVIKDANYTGSLSSVVLSNTDNIDITFYVNKDDYAFTGLDKSPINTKVGGINASLVSVPTGQNPAQELVLIKNNDLYYTIQFVWGEDTNKELLDTFNQILSTFKFSTKDCKADEYLKQCKLGPCCCPVGAICD